MDATRGCVALERGPIVHCLEQIDLPSGVEVDDLLVPAETRASAWDDGGLEISLLPRCEGGELYRSPAGAPRSDDRITVSTTPFSRWGNRGPGAMRIWLPREH